MDFGRFEMPDHIKELVKEIKKLSEATEEIYDWQGDWDVINNILVDEKTRLKKLVGNGDVE